MGWLKKNWIWVLLVGGAGYYFLKGRQKVQKNLQDLVGFVRSQLIGANVQGIPADLKVVEGPGGTVSVVGTYGGNPSFAFIQAADWNEAWKKAQSISVEDPFPV